MTDTTASETDVVLGDDWVRPNSAVENEVSQRRARRGVFSIYRSPLARKIVLFNMIALVLLVAGVLFTNPFRESLVQQRELTLIAQAEFFADVIAVLPPALAGDDARAEFLQNLTLSPEIEVFLLSPGGETLGRHQGESTRAAATLTTQIPAERTTLISDFLSSVWSGLTWITGSRFISSDVEQLDTVLLRLHRAALEGRSSSFVQSNMAEPMWLAAAAAVVENDGISAVVALRVQAEDVAQMLLTEREQLLQMFVIALLVSIGLSLALASTIANPLADLATAAELGRDSDARKVNPGRVRIPDLTGRPDEIGRLSKAMRGMVSALYERIDANEQFAADVSHEIKNPLASLRSAVGTLRVAKREDQIQRLLDVIEHDVRRLDRLVSDTSNASRLDSELVKEEEESFNLMKTLDNLTQHLSQEAAAKGVEFISAIPGEPIIIQGLEARLAQVFVNLITNAISFCGDGDAVRVWARKRDSRVLVVVEDTGPGIPDQALTRVFKRFYSERPENQFGNHSGLGLAISKQIVEAHGGVIWAENIRRDGADPTSPPLGARFVVGLPI
jgi:two-component system sensor histidine kinase ChvG